MRKLAIPQQQPTGRAKDCVLLSGSGLGCRQLCTEATSSTHPTLKLPNLAVIFFYTPLYKAVNGSGNFVGDNSPC